jgi:hypothetical protein
MAGLPPRRHLKQEQLRRLRLANDERERRSIKLDEAELALSVLCGIVRSAFGAAPAQLARDFAGQQSAEAVINACLSAAADALTYGSAQRGARP